MDETKPQSGMHPAIIRSFAGRMCPQLTQASMIGREIARVMKPQARVIVPLTGIDSAAPATGEDEPVAEAVSCIGPDCMWFMVMRDDKGTPIGGGCAILHQAYAMNQSAMAGAQIAHVLEQKK